jgi:guanylate kinase
MTTVFIISAPSGSGKTTLVSRLLSGVPGLMFSVSYTTRDPRDDDAGGKSYHFISRRPRPRARTWYSTSTCKVSDN